MLGHRAARTSPACGSATGSTKAVLVTTARPTSSRPRYGIRPLQPTYLSFGLGKREIIVHDPPPSRVETCKNPVLEVSNSQMALLDPTGARRRLFNPENREGAKPGDILLATFKSGESFSGIIMSIKQRGVDSSVLLRNHLTRIGTEMLIKIYSPLVQSMEIAEKTMKRKRRARLYYLRKPKHDVGSVEKTVVRYLRQRTLLMGNKPRGTNNQGRRSLKRK